MHSRKALLLSLVLAAIPAMGCLDAPEAENASFVGGECRARPLEVIVKGRENRFGLDGQQVALDPAIPIDRICRQVAQGCAGICAAAKKDAVATGVRGFQDADPVKLFAMGQLADNFNAALGLDTNFQDLGAAPGSPGALVCSNAKPLEVIVQGRENRFGLDGQQVALNPQIPIERICNQISGNCKQRCLDAQAAAVATGIKGFQDSDPVKLGLMGQLADTFNAAIGLTTNFKNLGTPAPGGGAGGGGAGGGGGGGALQCNAKLLQVVVKGREHRFGFDGRQVALNPSIPMQNICQQVSAGCTATCNSAKAAAEATGIKGFSGDDNSVLLGKMGQLADQFNAALGNKSNFAAGAIILP